MVLDLPAETIRWTKTNGTSDLHQISGSSGHVAVDIFDFGPNGLRNPRQSSCIAYKVVAREPEQPIDLVPDSAYMEVNHMSLDDPSTSKLC